MPFQTIYTIHQQKAKAATYVAICREQWQRRRGEGKSGISPWFSCDGVGANMTKHFILITNSRLVFVSLLSLPEGGRDSDDCGSWNLSRSLFPLPFSFFSLPVKQAKFLIREEAPGPFSDCKTLRIQCHLDVQETDGKFVIIIYDPVSSCYFVFDRFTLPFNSPVYGYYLKEKWLYNKCLTVSSSYIGKQCSFQRNLL